MQIENITSLRKNLYTAIDKVISTGKPIEIHRKGHVVKIVLDTNIDKFSRLIPHDAINGDPQDLIKEHPYTWNEEKNL